MSDIILATVITTVVYVVLWKTGVIFKIEDYIFEHIVKR